MLSTILPFLLASFIIELTPGPNMGYLAVLTLNRGRMAGLAAVAGVALGLLILGLVAGFGLGTVVGETRWLYELVRWAGVAFLLWLAWDAYRESRGPLERDDDSGRRWSYFTRGLVTNLLNPKAAVFYIAVLPNFVVADGAMSQELILSLAYVGVATIVHAGIVLLASVVQPLLTSDRLRARMGAIFAVLLVAIALWVMITTRRLW
jgi:threonine/homoserine/homoserine lactone efflux protein